MILKRIMLSEEESGYKLYNDIYVAFQKRAKTIDRGKINGVTRGCKLREALIVK